MQFSRNDLAAWVAMILVVLAATLTIWMTVSIAGTEPLGDRQPGLFFLGAAKSGAELSTGLKALPLLIASGLSFLIPKGAADWRFIVTVVALLVGLICSIVIYVALQDADTAHRLWSYSEVAEIHSPETLAATLPSRVLALAGWFLATLGVQVGVKLV